MRRFFSKLTASLLVISSATTACWAAADPSTALGTGLPMPRYYVEDYANVVNASHERSLNGILQELEQKTGAQYIILTVDTTGGMPIEQFAIEYAEKWKLGQEGKDNGMLFVFAAEKRQARFEVGYDLEGFITDQYTNRVGRNVLVPYIKQGKSRNIRSKSANRSENSRRIPRCLDRHAQVDAPRRRTQKHKKRPALL